MATVDASITEAGSASDEVISLHALVPIADVSVGGNWTNPAGGSLYPAVDEQVASASDFVRSGDEPESDPVEFQHATAWSATTPRVIAYEAMATGGGQINVTVQLWCDQTLIATFTDNNVAGVSKYYHALTAAQRAAITDKTKLYTKVIANKVGNTVAASITEAATAEDFPQVVAAAAPVWSSIPDQNFTQGIEADRSIASYVTDSEACTFDLASGTLPGAITFDTATATFHYDGTSLGATIGDPYEVPGVTVGADNNPSAPPSNFQTRAGDPSVFRWFDFNPTTGKGPEISSCRPENDYGWSSGSATTCAIETDTAINTAVAYSLRFDIPTQTDANASGLWQIQFAPDSSINMGANSHFFMQWRQRFNQAFIDTYLTENGGSGPQMGIKQVILDSGVSPTSHSGTHLVVNSYKQSRFSCAYVGEQALDWNVHEQLLGSGQEDYFEQGRYTQPLCTYRRQPAPPGTLPTDCECWSADEWLTFQIELMLGAPGTFNYGQYTNYPCYLNTEMRMWMAREGAASVQIMDWNPTCDGYFPMPYDYDYPTFGRVYLIPYMTNKDPTQSHSTLTTWFSELILATAKIADPA